MLGETGTWPLVGRTEELALLGEEAAAGRRAAVVAGDVGVGKSRLLLEWSTRHEAAGRPTVVVRATQATATIPFGAFARWAPEGASAGEGADRLGTMSTIAARLTALDTGGGVAVAIDDAQLLDDGSAALVLHLAHHTEASLLVTVRSGEACPDAVAALWKERLCVRVDLQALSEPQVEELLERALAGTVTPATRRRLWQLTSGNPLYLREVVGVAVGAGALAAVDGTWRWDGPLPGRARLTELVSDRIGVCTAEERRVLELLALGEPMPVEVVDRLAAGEVVAALEGRRLVAVDRRGGRLDAAVVRLAHPLYAEVLRAELPAFTSRAHHRALVDAVAGTPFEQRQPLRAATWLLEAGADAGRPDLLLRASLIALMTDDYALCARLAEASARAGGGWRATLRRAEALGPLRRWDEADALLDELATSPDPAAPAAAAQVRAEQAVWHRRRSPAVGRRIVVDAAATAPPGARASLLAHGARYALADLDVDAAIRLATDAAEAAATDEDRLDATGCLAVAATFAGRTGQALATARGAAAEALRNVERAPIGAGYVAFAYSFASLVDGRIDEAVQVFDGYRDHHVARMVGTPRAMSSMWSARAALSQGRVATAARLGGEALAVFGDDDPFGRGTWAAAVLAAAAAQAGDDDTASGALAWADARRHPAARTDGVLLDSGRTWVLAGRGEITAARGVALDVARRARAAGAPMFEALALLDVVRLGGAGAAVDRLGALVDVVDGRLVGAAARFARASAVDDGTALDDVAARFADLGALLLAAEASASAAAAHRIAGLRRAAAASTANAQAHAARCEGAATPLLADLGDVPLVRTLTDREREVAGLASRGRTSRQIAEALSISVRTVDSHLGRAYTKLGIGDRAGLAAALGVDERR